MSEKAEKPSVRYTRETWLKMAMEVLAREGPQNLNTVRLVAQLGVSRGSFYHHFESRDKFIEALLEYWSQITSNMIATMNSLGLPARERLLALMTQIRERKTDRYDIAIRGWAANSKTVEAKVREVDGWRYAFVKGMFSELGFEGAELEERTRLFIISESRQFTVSFPEESRLASDSLEIRLALYTAPIAQPIPGASAEGAADGAVRRTRTSL